VVDGAEAAEVEVPAGKVVAGIAGGLLIPERYFRFQ
jgi:hypothetical protein